MIELYVNGKLATLPTNASIPIKIHNPAFNKMGTYSEPFNLGKRHNRSLMDYMEDEDKLSTSSHTFILKVGGEVFMQGDIVVSDTVGAYKCNLKSGKSSFARKLKESFLDGDINGQSWGYNVDGLTGLNNSVNGSYPDYLMVPGVIKSKDFIVNDWDLDSSKLIEWVSDNEKISGGLNEYELASVGRINPQVYVAGLINRIWSGTGVLKTADDMGMKNDLNRLVIYAARKGINNTEVFNHVSNFLPHISASDLLNDIRSRFNLVAFFNSYLNEVEFLHFERLFSAPMHDWTDKFIRDEKRPPKTDQAIAFNNDGDDEDVISYADLEQSYELIEVAGYDDMISAIKDHWDFPDEYYKLLDSGRVFRANSDFFDAPLANRYYVQSSPQYYRFRLGSEIITDDYDYPIDFEGGVKTQLTSWWFPENQEGAAAEKITINHFGVYLRAGDVADVIVRVYAINLTTNDELTMAEIVVPITNTNAIDSPFNIDGGIELPLGQTAQLGSGWSEYRIDFHVLSQSAGTIAFKIGNFNPDPPFYAYADIDGFSRRVTELGRVASKTQGSGDTLEYSQKSEILLNSKEWMGDYRFQMPSSDIDPNIEQKDYAFSFYRGLISNEVTNDKTAPYINFDDVDIELNDYQHRVSEGGIPDVSLRWHGDNGLMKQFWSRTIFWWLNIARPVRKVFLLSKNDLINTKMWHRIKVKNKLYVINIISVKANADGSLTEATVDMFTL